ncbi:MAG: sigma-70 family RNA polymerase sigma factor [Bacteroidota bacterium]|nr:sigma-70 family RNA polymerase sigma factor [Bacteroidota bacterium]
MQSAVNTMDSKTEIFLEYKALLFSVAYNMLGIIENAEDMVQETYLKWMQLQSGPIKYVKAYLVKIITNKCINYLESVKVKREQYVGVWLPEPYVNYELDREHTLVDSYHALSIGVLRMLEKLTPQERAIFILHEVFSYDYKELAEIFDKAEDNCRQIFKRAKDNMSGNARRFEVDTVTHKKMVENFIEAFSGGKIEDLIELFKEDIVLYTDGGGKALAVSSVRLSAALNPIYGRENVSRFIINITCKIFEHVPDIHQEIFIANGVPSIISYSGLVPFSFNSFDLEEGKISTIYSQTNPDKLKQFVKAL